MKLVIKTSLLLIFFNIFFIVRPSYPHPLLPTPMYDPDKEYRIMGKPIPRLPKGKIALVGGKYIKESDYIKWLGRKIGGGFFGNFIFELSVEQKIKRLGIKIEDKDIDLFVNKKVCEEMELLKGNLDEVEKARIRERKKKAYLKVLRQALIIYKEWNFSENEIRKKFKEKYGKYNKKYKLKHIFSPIKRKALTPRDEGYKEAVAQKEEKSRKKLEDALKRIRKADSMCFEETAELISDDKNTKYAGGYLGKYSKGKFGYEFDKAVSSTKEGEISEVFRSNKKYHVVKVLSKEGEDIEISHIQSSIDYFSVIDMKLWNKEKEKVLEKMRQIRKRLNKGEDFDKIAEEESEDCYTEYGFSPTYGWDNKWDVIFGENLWDIKKGDISDIILTDRGVHIVKIEDVLFTDFNDTIREEIKKEAAYLIVIRDPYRTRNELLKEAEITVFAEDMAKRKKGIIAIVNGRKVTGDMCGKWAFDNLNTATYLENYISTLLFERKAKELGIKISKENIEKVKTERQNKPPMNQRSKNIDYNIRVDLQTDEIRSDLYASGIIYNREITEKEIRYKFSEKFGWNGRKYKIRHIFKRIRKKYLSKNDIGYDEAVRKMKETARKKIERIYKKIQEEGENKFGMIAQEESEDLLSAVNWGYIGEFTGLYKGRFDELLSALKEGEISGILELDNKFYVIKVDRKEGQEIYISHIVVNTFYQAVEDINSWNQNKKELMKEMEKLLERVKKGEDFEKLAEENSDYYDRRYGSYVSDLKMAGYRTKFRERLMGFKKGDIGIVESYLGLHIIKIEDLEITEYTDELKEKLRDEIKSGVASFQEMINLGDKLMKEAQVYYEKNP